MKEDIRDIENFKPRTHQERVDKLMIELLSGINSKLDLLVSSEVKQSEEPCTEAVEVHEVPVAKKTRKKKEEVK